MRPALLACAFAGLLGLAAEAPAAADVYRWVDASGTVHFTQVAPRGIPYERVTASGRGPAPAPSIFNPVRPRSTSPEQAPSSAETQTSDAAPTLTEAQQREQEALEAEAQARLAEIAAVKAENCRNARAQFRQFTTYARIRLANPDGSMRIITEEERQQRIAEAQEAILANCDGAG